MFDVHATQEEDKLVLLCALDRLGGCTQEQLLRFLVETQLQDQFRSLMALGDLKEAELVRETKRLEGRLLTLTPEGRQSMEMFSSTIRASLQEKLRENGDVWKRRFQDERQLPAEYAQTGNTYAVTLRTLESGEEIFCVKLTAATKEQAKRFCARWPEEAAGLYQTIMSRLGETERPDEGETDTPSGR